MSNKAVPIIAHENERVIPANKRKKVERLMKREGMALTNRKGGNYKRRWSQVKTKRSGRR